MKRSLILIILLLLVLGSAASSFAKHSAPYDSVRLKVVFPADGDTLNFDRIRFAGSVQPSAQVRVQGDEVPVYSSGAFVGMVDLQAGWNEITFAAIGDARSVRDTIRIFRDKTAVLGERPTAVDPAHIKPGGNVYVSPGDDLEVEFRGSPGGEASFSIENIAENVKMKEIKENERGGIYRGKVRIPNLDHPKPVPVRFRLRGRDGRTLKFESPGNVRILPKNIELFGITSDSVNIVRREVDGDIWLQLPARVKMRITGVYDRHKKVELAPGITGYIETESLKALPIGWPYPRAEIGEISVVEFGNWVQLQMPLSQKVPFEIRQRFDPQALEVVFYHTTGALPEIQTQNGGIIQSLDWQQNGDGYTTIRIILNQSQQWGFWGIYLGNQFWLNIRKGPISASESQRVLEGIRVTLDPGHGGESEGAVSPTGLTEKQLNLRLSQKVAHKLQLAGATVSMTRSRDSTLSLDDRIAFARKNNAHILISLHHNSIAPDKDPMRPRGTSVYFDTPQSQKVASLIYRNLLDLKLAPFGLRRAEYYVARQTDLLAVLIEGAFLTHPEDELLLLDDAFLDKMAQAIVTGLEEFISST